jgi:glycerate kinase
MPVSILENGLMRNSTPVAVCAPNAFKGTLTARVAAAAMARGVRDSGVEATEIPVADGGDGTLEVLLAARPAAARITHHRVTGPYGTPLTARLGWIGPADAVVELAEASGLRRVAGRPLDGMHATSRGTGELIAAALAAGARSIIVGVGGSACTDAGAGLLQALGARLTDGRGEDIGPGGAGLRDIARIDLSRATNSLQGCRVEVACDIRSPLLGTEGAALMFSPQKGATPNEVHVLDATLAHFAAMVTDAIGRDLSAFPGAGAAGGCGFGLALIGASLLPGAALVCDLVGLDQALARASVVITGEGRLDRQTSTGKAPAEVARRARAHDLRCVAIAGTVVDQLTDTFDLAIALDGLEPGLDPRRHARRLLRRAARQATSDLFRPPAAR